jgi:hypothetical protein
VRHRIRLAATALTATGMAFAAVACGSAATPDAGPTGEQNGFEAYVSCLRDNGVTLPTRSPGAFRSGRPSQFPSRRPSDGAGDGAGGPGGGGRGFGGFGDQAPPGVDQATWDKARQACASVRPSFGPGGGNNSALAAYRNCLRDHGVTASAGPSELKTSDPTVAAAVKVCEPLRPTRRPAPSPSA